MTVPLPATDRICEVPTQQVCAFRHAPHAQSFLHREVLGIETHAMIADAQMNRVSNHL